MTGDRVDRDPGQAGGFYEFGLQFAQVRARVDQVGKNRGWNIQARQQLRRPLVRGRVVKLGGTRICSLTNHLPGKPVVDDV